MALPEKAPPAAVDVDVMNASDPAPILGSWRNLYAFVLASHALIIILFYLFSRAYA